MYVHHTLDAFNAHTHSRDVSIAVTFVNISSIKGGIILSNANNYLKFIYIL